MAAQLQALASPGEVVIAASTHRLVGRMFDCRALDAIEVKGLPHPGEAWRVRGEKAAPPSTSAYPAEDRVRSSSRTTATPPGN